MNYRRLLVILLLLTAVFPVLSCQQRSEPSTVAFIAGLTGRGGGLGQEGRDAFLLAVDQFNRQGGIDGKPVETLVVDHLSTPDGMRAALEQLQAAGVGAVVGPMSSQVAVQMAPETERLGMTLISPTVSTDVLSDKRDLFFRPHYIDRQAAVKLAGIFTERQLKSVAIIQDNDNHAYSESWNRSFQRVFSGSVETLSFSSSSSPSFTRLVEPLQENSPDAVLILANAPDTGLICQQLVKQGTRVALFATCWSASGPLISYGGHSVEGLEFLHSINISSKSATYEKFSHDFLSRYNRRHLFPAMHTYDATMILLQALAAQKANETLPDALLRLRSFQGLQYPLVFSDSGDLVDPPLFLTRVKDARFNFVRTVD